MGYIGWERLSIFLLLLAKFPTSRLKSHLEGEWSDCR
jgi:hypothetical protein